MSLLRFVKKGLTFSLFALLAFFLARALFHFCNKETDGFSIAAIHSTAAYHPEWELCPSLDQQKELEEVLRKKFIYLGFGGQCYAFSSEDGSYVLKFFKNQLQFIPERLLSFPIPFLQGSLTNKFHKKMRKVKRDYTSCCLAFQELQEECALIYVQLNKSQGNEKQVTLVDKLNIAHQVDLTNTAFVLQKKAVPLIPHFEKLCLAQDKASIEESMQSLKNLIVARCQKGIFDEDPSLHRNIGFIGNKAIFIDVGRFKKDESRKNPSIYSADIKIMLEQLQKRFICYPELVSHLQILISEGNKDG